MERLKLIITGICTSDAGFFLTTPPPPPPPHPCLISFVRHYGVLSSTGIPRTFRCNIRTSELYCMLYTSLLLLLLCREAFLPGSKAGVHSSQTEAAYGPDSVGKYDPILHKWIIEPDQQKWQAREREHANEVTVSATLCCSSCDV